jgi:hypothetical protein
MAVEMNVDEKLGEAFYSALLLTGSSAAAELAVTDAIDSCDPDVMSESLVIETARSAIQQHKRLPQQSDLLGTVPIELRALSMLSPTCRYCFVLRILMRLEPEVCSELMGLSRDGVEGALYHALINPPRAVESVELKMLTDASPRAR